MAAGLFFKSYVDSGSSTTSIEMTELSLLILDRNTCINTIIYSNIRLEL